LPAPSKVTPEIRAQVLYFAEMGVSARKIADKHLKGQISRITTWRIISEAKHYVSKHNVSDSDRSNSSSNGPVISTGFQIGHYQPAMLSSFNGGLGAGTPQTEVQKVIQQIANSALTPYEKKAEELKLRQFLSGKDGDKTLGQLRQILKEVMEFLFGFNGDSDADKQFGDLNELARFLMRARKYLGKTRFKPKQLVYATLSKTFGPEVEQKLTAPEKHLSCPRCRKPRSFAIDKNPAFYLCLSCGKQVPVDRAKFTVTVHRIDPRYLRTVEKLLATSPLKSIHSQNAIEVKA